MLLPLIITIKGDHEDISEIIFMPPTSKKLRGHIGLGLSIRLSVRNIFGSAETQEPLRLES